MSKSENKKAIAVLISDVHYNLSTLTLADKAMRMAITQANDLGVPLIVAGDLHDTKANLRGECMNAMIETFKCCHEKPYVLIGNHDRLNEKAPAHSLNFLQPCATLIEKPTEWNGWVLTPYLHDPKDFPLNYQIICHQGLQKGFSGDYINDHSAVRDQDIAAIRVISGHYHTRQTIYLSQDGRWDYIGNPYSLTWGEAKDPEKGFQILYEDGSLQFVPTNLRKHIIIELEAVDLTALANHTARMEDLMWVKIKGNYEDLSQITRGRIAKLLGREVFKLTLEPTSSQQSTVLKNSTVEETLDSILDTTSSPDRLKKLWRELCE